MSTSRYIKKLKTFAAMSHSLNDLSTCKRTSVSAIIFPIDCSQVYSIGYNGPSAGLSNESCTNIKDHCGCVHAEINALIKFSPMGAKPSLLYCDTMPCVRCASAILNCDKVIGVLWKDPYRNKLGEDLLRKTLRIHVINIIALNICSGVINDWISMSKPCNASM